MKKEIAMLITLGLVLTVGVLTTIYPEHAGAFGFGRGGFGNGIHGENSNPGLTTACATPAAANNPNC